MTGFFMKTTLALNGLSDSNRIRTHNHVIVCKRTLNHLAKLSKWFTHSHQICSLKKGIFKFSLSWNENTIAGVSPIKLQPWRRLQWRCFPVNFQKLLRTLFLRNNSGWLLLEYASLSKTSSTKPAAFLKCEFVAHVFQKSYFQNGYERLLMNG